MKTVSENRLNIAVENSNLFYAEQLPASSNYTQHTCVYRNNTTPSARQLLQQLPVAVISINSQGTVTYLNAIAGDMLTGCVPGSKWSNIISTHFTVNDREGQQLQLNNGALVDISTAPMEDGDGQIIMLTDTTDVNRLQTDINKNQRLSELGKMASFLAHQIRTPVATALLILSRLRQTLQSNDRKSVENVISRLRHLDGVVTDILIYAKGDRSVLQETSLKDLLDEFVFIVEKKCETHDVTLNHKINFTKTTAMLNQNMYLSAIMNVVDNAIESMKERRHLYIEVSSEHGQLTVQIADTGSGMNKETIEQMFSPFYTSKGNGTGLGLAVLEMVVTQHGGTVNVNSEVGCGTNFIITVPLEQKM